MIACPNCRAYFRSRKTPIDPETCPYCAVEVRGRLEGYGRGMAMLLGTGLGLFLFQASWKEISYPAAGAPETFALLDITGIRLLLALAVWGLAVHAAWKISRGSDEGRATGSATLAGLLYGGYLLEAFPLGAVPFELVVLGTEIDPFRIVPTSACLGAAACVLGLMLLSGWLCLERRFRRSQLLDTACSC